MAACFYDTVHDGFDVFLIFCFNASNEKRNSKERISKTRTMMKFYCQKSSTLCTLATLFLALGSTSHGFAPSPKQASVHGASNVPSSFASPCRKKHALAAHPLILIGHGSMVSGFPNNMLLMKDVSGPLSSILEPLGETDPDTEAQFLLDISHLLLDFTAFFKFDGKFLNFAQIAGRISFILIDFLPGHAFHAEEMAVQLFLLGVSLQRMMPDREEPSENPGENELRFFDKLRPEATMGSVLNEGLAGDDELTMTASEESELEMNEIL
jgi:hypothetical protein